MLDIVRLGGVLLAGLLVSLCAPAYAISVGDQVQVIVACTDKDEVEKMVASMVARKGYDEANEMLQGHLMTGVCGRLPMPVTTPVVALGNAHERFVDADGDTMDVRAISVGNGGAFWTIAMEIVAKGGTS